MRERLLQIHARLFAKKRFSKLNNFLMELGLRGLGILNYQNFEISGEKFLIDFLKKNYRLDTIFDIGANNGQYASLFEHDTNLKVYSFEPNPRSFRTLKERFDNSSSVKTFEFGFSDFEGPATIFDRSDEEGSQHASIFEKVITDIHNAGVVSTEISLTTIDKFLIEQQLNHISLLKIDTEGNELAVLRGARAAINEGKIDILHLEFNEMNVISKVFLKDFVELLPGYNFYRLLPNEFLPINYEIGGPLRYEIFAFQNIVAFRKDMDKIKT